VQFVAFRRAAGTDSWRTAIAAVLPIWVAVRAAVAAMSLVAMWTRHGPSVTDRAGTPVLDTAGDGFFAVLAHWDSGYYLAIASGGYFAPDGPPNLAAFFPGYPLAARGLSGIMTLGSSTTGSLVVSMWLISTVSSMVAAVVLWRLVQQIDPRAAVLAAVLFLAGPYSIFLYANYAEPLFLALAISAWYCGIRQRWWLAGVWCGCAGLVRINGIFLLAGLITLYAVQQRRSGRPVLSRSALWVLPAVSGVVGYFGYLALRTGDVFAWNTAQSAGWGRRFGWPWEAFYQTAGRVLFASTLDRRLQFAFDLVVAGLMLIAVAVWVRRRQWAPAAFAGTMLAALITSFTFVSLARNSIAVFPLIVLLAGSLMTARRWIRGLVLGTCIGLSALNGTLFALGYWTD
jgi:hypothetical protein